MEMTVEHSIPLDILDDLSSRFIINVPEEERKDLIRIFFQIEQAHWFYLDFYCAQDNSRLKSCSIKEFAAHIFQHIPFLKPFYKDLDGVWEQWREYKQAVPTFGAVVLNENLTHVLLVQSFWAKTSWGFPKGKVNADEDPSRCAIREVFEETGYDISKLVDPNDYLEATINYQLTRLYVVSGVKTNTKFQPQTRNEIRSVEWFAIADLPTNKKDTTTKARTGVGPNSLYMVLPFVKKIRTWIWNKQQKQNQEVQGTRRQRHKSVGEAESLMFKNKQQSQQLAVLPHASSTDTRKSTAVRDATKELKSLKRTTVRVGNLQRQDQTRGNKPPTKRQLFPNDGSLSGSQSTTNGAVRNGKELQKGRADRKADGLFAFCPASWANFKFNLEAILKEAFPDRSVMNLPTSSYVGS